MPNVSGTKASKRKLLAKVIHSQLLYVALSNKRPLMTKNCYKNLHEISLYKSMEWLSHDLLSVAEVIARIPPIKLMVTERKVEYIGQNKKEARA